jgi:hypothetical protein
MLRLRQVNTRETAMVDFHQLGQIFVEIYWIFSGFELPHRSSCME